MDKLIKNDIMRINEAIECIKKRKIQLPDNVESELESIDNFHTALVSKYSEDISDIDDVVKNKFATSGNKIIDGWENNWNDRSSYYIRSLGSLKERLERLLIKEENNKQKNQSEPTAPIKIVTNINASSDNHAINTLSNTNNNTVSVELLFENSKNNMENNDILTGKEKSEILSKIEELEELYKSEEKPKDKWEKAKETMAWLVDKGVKVAVELLPLITEAIK